MNTMEKVGVVLLTALILFAYLISWHDMRQSTSHDFESGVVYTIESHDTIDGKKMVAVSSGSESGTEAYVAVWSALPDLVTLPDGSKFRILNARRWNQAIEVVESKSH